VKKLISVFAHHPVLSNIIMLAVLAGGVLAAFLMKTELLPEFSLDRVMVSVVYPGTSPSEIEEGICIKIEEAIQGIPGVKRIQSISREGVGMVIAELKADVADPRKVQYDIRDAVERIDTFPVDAERPITQELVLRRHVVNIAVYGDAPEATLKEIARSVKDDLLAMPQISQVEWGGVRDYEIAIEVGEEALRKYRLTFEQVARAVRAASVNLPGGTIRGKTEEIKINTEGRRYVGSEYAGIVVLARADGTKVRLDQVATIIDGFEEDPKFTRFNGKPAVTVSVHKTGDEDAVTIARTVREYCRRRAAELPEGVRIEPWADMSKLIYDRLNLLKRNARLGIVLVFFCLWFFMNVRLSFWVAMGIPTSFAGGLIFMYLTGQSINMISMFALIMAMGIVVDDAIIVGENVYAHARRGMPVKQAVVDATVQVGVPVVASVTTTVCAFAPLLFVAGTMGKFIHVMPLAVIAILLASLLECFFILPAHLRHVRVAGAGAPEGARARESRWRVRLALDRFISFVVDHAYRRAFRRALRNRYVTIAIALMALALCGALYKFGIVGYLLFPKADSDVIVARVVFPEGTPVHVTEAAVKRIESVLGSINEKFNDKADEKIIQQVLSTVGQWTMGGEEVGPHAGEVLVQLASAEKRAVKSEEIISAWRELVGPVPDAVSLTFQGLRGGPPSKPIEILLRGGDFEELRSAAAEVKRVLSEYNGVSDVTDDYRPGKLEFQVRTKPAGRVLGVSDEVLGRQLRYAFYGLEALKLQRGRDEVKVRVRYPRKEREKLADVERMRIRTGDGREVPFYEVADVKLAREPAAIKRQDGKRRITVFADVDEEKANADKIIADFKEKYLAGIQERHPGTTLSFEGQKQETREALGALKITFPLALIVIFAILAAQFRSYLKPVIIMFSIPFGIVGAILGHFLMGMDITLLSVFGLVAVSGVVVNDALVLIDFVNRNVRAGIPVFEAVALAGPMRFRAITMTSLTTIAGLAPLIFERSFQAQFLIPMAVSISYGLAMATLLNLFVTPCFYLALNDAKRVARWLWCRRWPTAEDVEAEFAAEKE